MKKGIAKALTALLLLSLFFGCRMQPKQLSRTDYLLDTVVTLTLYGATEADLDAAFREIRRLGDLLDAYAPFSGTKYDLIKDEFVEETKGVAVKKTFDKGRISSVFQRLLAAGERLLSVIRKYEHGANKDLGKFADQINSLCDKWDR